MIHMLCLVFSQKKKKKKNVMFSFFGGLDQCSHIGVKFYFHNYPTYCKEKKREKLTLGGMGKNIFG